jgi:hypothetical protein
MFIPAASGAERCWSLLAGPEFRAPALAELEFLLLERLIELRSSGLELSWAKSESPPLGLLSGLGGVMLSSSVSASPPIKVQ